MAFINGGMNYSYFNLDLQNQHKTFYILAKILSIIPPS